MLCVYLAGILFQDKVLLHDRRNLAYYNLMAAAIILQFGGGYFLGANRVAYYFYVFAIVFMPVILKAIESARIRRMGYVAVIVLTTIQFALVALYGDSRIAPYDFFWE
jgi:hypothetical protein